MCKYTFAMANWKRWRCVFPLGAFDWLKCTKWYGAFLSHMEDMSLVWWISGSKTRFEKYFPVKFDLSIQHYTGIMGENILCNLHFVSSNTACWFDCTVSTVCGSVGGLLVWCLILWFLFLLHSTLIFLSHYHHHLARSWIYWCSPNILLRSASAQWRLFPVGFILLIFAHMCGVQKAINSQLAIPEHDSFIQTCFSPFSPAWRENSVLLPVNLTWCLFRNLSMISNSFSMIHYPFHRHHRT